MQWNPSIFREYDIRGVADRDLSAEFARHLGWAFGKKAVEKIGIPHPKLSVGQDCRSSSPQFAEHLISGLREAGIEVTRLGVCPTPTTYFSVYELGMDGAIMVTGSHNPAEYNGFKMVLGGESFYGEAIQSLRIQMGSMQRPKTDRLGTLQENSIIPAYIEKICSQFSLKRKLRVVVDAGNGTAGNVAPDLYKKLGMEVIPMFCELDGSFPNHHPDPTVVENLAAMIEEVKRSKADVGLAFDGDSDRIGVVDGKGNVLFGDELMIVLSRAVLKSLPGATILSEVKSSNRLYRDIEAKGGRPIMWKTGHSLIKTKMKEEKAALAGEMSGHIFFADRYYGFDDALYAGARLLEILSETGQSLHELTSDIPKVEVTPEIRIDCREELKFDLVKRTAEKLQRFADKSGECKVITLDGIRLEFEKGWGLLRASNTQPVLVLRFEGQSKDDLENVRQIFLTELESAAQELHHEPLFP